MKKRFILLLLGLVAVLTISACGEKSKEDVVGQLNKQVEQMKSYKVNAKMTLKMGMDAQVYDVDVWYKKPHYYRVNLKSAEKDQSQMIIRNDNDVFVLTPALNKSFRFQSDWPKNSSQAYLYESLIEDIIQDKEAKFTQTKEHYVFETKTRYQNNKMLPLQEIKLHKKTLAPVGVKIMDPDRKELVKVSFSAMEFNVEFEKKDFDLKKNMTGARLELPVMADPVHDDFAIKFPTAELPGVILTSENELQSDTGRRVMLTYEGEGKSFTFIQEKAHAVAAVTDVATSTYVKGEPVDLGFTIGAITESALIWTSGGVDYMIASNDLSSEEFIMLASSVQDGVLMK